MEKSQKKYVKQYLHQLKQSFPFGYPKLNVLIKETHASILSFSAEHPDFTYDDLVNNFGTPPEYADSLISYTDPEVLRKNVKLKKRTYFIIGGITLVLIIAIFVIAIILYKNKAHMAVSGYETIVDEDSNPIDYDEEIIIE